MAEYSMARQPVARATGREVPYEVDMGMTVATPVMSGSLMLVSSFYNSARLLKLDDTKPSAVVVWRGDNEAPFSLMNTPIIERDYIYGMSQGWLVCWELATGHRVWRSQELVKERTQFTTAFFVRKGDRYFINTERGDLVIGRFSPQGFQEISRTHLIEPTHPNGRRQDLGPIHWSHPAYPNKHIYVRNDKEILKASLAKD
jgi:outer membrane protein assembly factor BamB